jgi:PadR family transcriptional regulator, regulatory protein PadR
MLVSAMPKEPMLPGTLELLVLRTLAIEPMHGYAIAQHIQKLSKDALKIEEGSLYPALQRILVKKWATAAWRESLNGRRIRVYTLTAAGQKQLGLEKARFHVLYGAIRNVLKGA